ncbi:unnamed protein product [Spirodela intermedia]|uniref:Uncharacterized protein n=1 Tax=Spirodela intermedia TaxID=51605 RepID=A0A7I8IMM3_SPIIN|nr:unnamed protein product [Spirodela intermedia]CAA6658213.1 unnamed protein product [Spirodela intermedia]
MPCQTKSCKRARLSTISHLAPYKILWIDTAALLIRRQCHVPLRVSTYDEHILCDVPFDENRATSYLDGLDSLTMNIQLMGRANTCSFMYRDRRLVWYLHTNKPCRNHIRHRWISDVLCSRLDMRDNTTLTSPSLEVEGILLEYADILPEELPRELPPLRHIQYAIHLVPRASLSNMPHYHMEPAKYKELSQ